RTGRPGHHPGAAERRLGGKLRLSLLSQDAIVGRAMPVPVAGSIRRIAPARYDVRDAVGWKTREAIFHAGRARIRLVRDQVSLSSGGPRRLQNHELRRGADLLDVAEQPLELV